jgi:hypothetical protein
MPVRIARKKTFCKTEISVESLCNTGRNHSSTGATEASHCGFGASRGEGRLPVPQIICARILWRRAAVAWREILEKLDPGASLGSQAANLQARARDVVQAFLLRTIVHTLTGKFES